jgi:hypothetical protein
VFIVGQINVLVKLNDDVLNQFAKAGRDCHGSTTSGALRYSSLEPDDV